MPRKNVAYLTLGISIAVLVLTVMSVHIQTAKAKDNSLSNTHPNCIYGLDTGLLKRNGMCPMEGTPTILSQAKEQIAGDLDYIVRADEKQYRTMVFDGLECKEECFTVNITEACHYDSNGQFIPHLSDAQKAAILDLKNSFSIPVCPFTGQPNVFANNTSPNTVIGPSGSVNVMNLTNTSSNNAG